MYPIGRQYIELCDSVTLGLAYTSCTFCHTEKEKGDKLWLDVCTFPNLSI